MFNFFHIFHDKLNIGKSFLGYIYFPKFERKYKKKEIQTKKIKINLKLINYFYILFQTYLF